MIDALSATIKLEIPSWMFFVMLAAWLYVHSVQERVTRMLLDTIKKGEKS